MRKAGYLAAVGALSMASCAFAASITVANSGFEMPDLGSGGGAYQYPPHGGAVTLAQQGGSGFTFVGGSGIAANGSAFGVTGASNTNPGGASSTSGQAGLIQGGDGTTSGSGAVYFSQELSGFQAGTATVSFLTEARGNNQGPNPFLVELDGTALSFGGSTTVTPPTNNSFTSETSAPIAVSAGTHTLTFVGIGVPGADVTSFIDNVSVTNTPTATTPLPASAWGGLVLLGGLGVARLRRTKLA